jgi:cobalt-precorrin-7 (C5)-methyltransferase
MMIPFYIIGIGPGSKDYLTRKACDIISGSDILAGSHRAIATVDFIIKKMPGSPEIFYIKQNREALTGFIKDKQDSKRISALVTGDAGFYSLLDYISRHFDRKLYEVCPGVSSVQVAASRLGILWHNAFFYSIHGRDMGTDNQDFIAAFDKGKSIYVLTDKKRNPPRFIATLGEKGFPLKDMQMTLFFNLAYDDEEIIDTDWLKLEKDYSKRKDKLCILLIRKKK